MFIGKLLPSCSLLSNLSIKKWVNKSNATKVMIVGIGYPCFSLANTLQAHERQTKKYLICAFIDDEPWTNRTQIVGTTIYYPSDIIALIERKQIDLVITIENEPPFLSEELLNDIQKSKADLLTLSASQTTKQHLDILNNSIKNHS